MAFGCRSSADTGVVWKFRAVRPSTVIDGDIAGNGANRAFSATYGWLHTRHMKSRPIDGFARVCLSR